MLGDVSRRGRGARRGARVVTLIVWRRLVPRVPGYIVALLGGTAVVAVFGLPVETIGTRFGGIPRGLADLDRAAVPTRPDRCAAVRRR